MGERFLFFIVPHEEYKISISRFYDEIIREPSSLHLQQHPLSPYDDTHPHGCTYGIPLSHLETHDFHCSLPSPFDVGGSSSHTWVKIHIIEGNFCWNRHTMLFHDDIHIHECIDETSVSHLKSPCFICSLFGSIFVGISSFTSCMNEQMADYIDADYIIWEKHYGTWDPNLCHRGRYDIILHACVYGIHGDLLTWSIIWDPGIIFCFIGFNCGGNKQHWRFIHH